MFDTSMSESQFQQLSSIVYDVSGINLSDRKKNLLKARLAKRLRATKTTSVKNYIKLIQHNSIEFGRFIDGVTTNHTYFFRENSHVEFLLKKLDRSRPLKFWSAASSSGEEPYSIAIQFREKGFTFDIFASDISDSMLEAAKKGVYSIDRLRVVPKSILYKYFLQGKNDSAGKVKIRDEIKSHVVYGKHNLASDKPPKERYDVIFCRNVMIYFDLPTKQKVINDMHEALKPEGYFIFGQSESMVGLSSKFTNILPSVYQKK